MVAPAKNQRGYVALLTVLIVGAAALAICLTLLITGTDRQRETLVIQQSTQARTLAVSCAEEALQLMRENTNYTGTSNLSLGGGTCTYTVTSTGASTRTIATTGTVGGVVKKLQAYATISSSSLSISSWQEVT